MAFRRRASGSSLVLFLLTVAASGCAHRRSAHALELLNEDPLWPRDEASVAERERYFNRLRDRVKKVWPGLMRRRLLAADPNGCGAQGNVQTVVRFSVRADGTIFDPYVAQSSGMIVLDDTAVDVLLALSPLEPPPQQILAGRDRANLRFEFRVTDNVRRCVSRGASALPPSGTISRR